MVTVSDIASPRLLEVLTYLGRAAEGYRLSEAPFVSLPPKTHPKTIRTLIAKDFMVCSTALKEPEYKITSRGVKALAEIRAQIQRRPRKDGLCRTCGIRPVYVSPGGTKKSICKDCHNIYCRERYHLNGGQHYRADRPCSLCGAPRYVSPKGIVSRYCLTCRRKTHGAYMRDYLRRLATRVKAGEVVTCSRCHERPVTASRNGYVQAYCRECLRIKWAQGHRQVRIKNIQRRLTAYKR
jgi:hypothetical protein